VSKKNLSPEDRNIYLRQITNVQNPEPSARNFLSIKIFRHL
jgi:hypothetical protein